METEDKKKIPKLNSPFDTKEEIYLRRKILVYIQAANYSRFVSQLPPINIPKRILYSEYEIEKVDKTIESVPISSILDERAKSQVQGPNQNELIYKVCLWDSKVTTHKWELKSDFPTADNTEFLR